MKNKSQVSMIKNNVFNYASSRWSEINAISPLKVERFSIIPQQFTKALATHMAQSGKPKWVQNMHGGRQRKSLLNISFLCKQRIERIKWFRGWLTKIKMNDLTLDNHKRDIVENKFKKNKQCHIYKLIFEIIF